VTGPTVALSVATTLSEVVDTPARRWLATAVVLVVVLAGSWSVRRTGLWLRDRYDPHGSYLEAAQAAVIVALSAVATAAVLGIWQASAEASALTAAFQPNAETVVRGLVTLFLFLGAWGATVFAKRVIGVLFEERDAFSRHQRTVSYHVVQLVLYLFAIVASVAVWGIDLGDILLGAGFLSVVVGLAARQTLASVLAGFVLLFGRPFDIGDWVAVDGQEGIVTDVSIFNTELRTFNGESLVLPNDVVTAETLVNRSRRGRLRVDVEVGVDYDTDLDRARELAVEAVERLDTDDIRDYPEPVAVYTEFGDSAVVLEVRFWIDDPTAARRWNSRTAVISAVKTAFEDAGIAIPFPQRTLGSRGGERNENVLSVPTSEEGGERS